MSSVTREDVINCYRHILGREPESDAVIRHHLATATDFWSLIKNFTGSVEFAHQVLRGSGSQEPAWQQQYLPSESSAWFDRNFDCYVISLAKCPEKTTGFFERNRPTYINFKIFHGIDGTEQSVDDAIRMGVVAPGATDYTMGSIGCAASHLSLWRNSIANDHHIMIFEDDAFIRHDFKHHIRSQITSIVDWDIILFGFNIDSSLDIRMIPGCDFGGRFSLRYPSLDNLLVFAKMIGSTTLYRLNNAFGLCGYALSPSGARKLVELCFPMDNRPLYIRFWNKASPCKTIDMMMNCFFSELRSYVCFPPLVLSPNDHTTSTTLKRETT